MVDVPLNHPFLGGKLPAPWLQVSAWQAICKDAREAKKGAVEQRYLEIRTTYHDNTHIYIYVYVYVIYIYIQIYIIYYIYIYYILYIYYTIYILYTIYTLYVYIYIYVIIYIYR